MGGVVAGCFSAIDGMQRIENVHMKKIRENGVVTTAVDSGEGYLIRRSNSAAKMSRDEINAKFTADQSMPLMLKAACKKFGNKNALGFRKIVKAAKEKITDEKGNEKDWEFLYLSDTEYMTFNTLWEKVVALANGLASSGVKAGGKVALYEETRWEWLVSCYAIWTLGATPVTVYANLGEDALVYALKEAEVDAVICNAKAVKKLITLCCKNEINIETVIATDMNTPIENSESNTKVLAWESVVDAGAGKEIPDTMSQSPEDLALIMYTSGTTGDPKGVMLTQGNVLAAVSGLDHRLAEILSNVENPSYCAYLPLAHILEFAAENVMLKNGFLLGYGNPRTLTNTSARPHGDLQEFKPVFFAGVPRIFDTIKKAVEGKLPPEGSLKRQVFERAFAERKDALLKGQDTPFFSKKVFTPLAALLGGRVRYIVSGGAPLSAKTQEWLSIVFGTNTATSDPFCCVGQGYGLTETGAACTLQDFGDNSFETAGRLLQCCEVKLRTVEEFRVTDEPPRGEILIRGPTISRGYYKQAEKTREAFLEDGFFATGDVGSFDKKGYLKIVGRVKALAKNAHGEYIAMEALESMYVQNSLVLPNGICVVVDPHQPFIVAVALTDQAKAMSFCKEKNIEGSWPEVLQDEKFRKAAIASLGVTAKENGKKPFETLKNVRFYADEWTPENGVLTAAMKLKRREIDAKYGDDIKAMFSSA